MRRALSSLVNRVRSASALATVRSFASIVIAAVTPWFIGLAVLHQFGLVFYNPFLTPRVLLFDIAVMALLLYVTLSPTVAITCYYIVQAVPFVTYYLLRRGVTFQDVRNLDELFLTIGLVPRAVVLALLLLLLALAVRANAGRLTRRRIAGLALIAVVAVIGWRQPARVQAALYDTAHEFDYNASASFRFYGVVDSLVYSTLHNLAFARELRERAAEATGEYEDFRSYVPPPAPAPRPNVHLILLESFLDPYSLASLRIDAGPLQQQWRAWQSGTTATAIAPIMGGASAASEFELLCGVASNVQQYGVEFNRMEGRRTQCLPAYLKTLGYDSYAATPIRGAFFNVATAYKSVGFDDIRLADTFDYSDMDGLWLSNESFFDQQLRFITPKLRGGKPIFSFTFALACHSPFALDEAKRPVTFALDARYGILQAVSACGYYTIAAVVRYVNAIQSLDPHGLIFILPDHVPPIPVELLHRAQYRPYSDAPVAITSGNPLEGFINTVLALNLLPGRMPGVFAYHELPEIIVDALTDGALCRDRPCSSYRPIMQVGQRRFFNRHDLSEVTASRNGEDGRTPVAATEALYRSILRESLAR